MSFWRAGASGPPHSGSPSFGVLPCCEDAVWTKTGAVGMSGQALSGAPRLWDAAGWAADSSGRLWWELGSHFGSPDY